MLSLLGADAGRGAAWPRSCWSALGACGCTGTEQAKGKLAERLSIDMDRSFTMIRDYARNSNQHLTDVARDFVNGATAEFPRRPGSSRANGRRRDAGIPPLSP
jgi:hypothetical protein